MKELGEQGSLTERFGSVIAEDVAHALIQAARTRKEADDIQHGQKSGSIESVQLGTAAASKKAQGSAQEKAEKEAKERAEDQMFLALLQQQIDALNKEIDRTNDQIKALEAKIDVLSDAIDALQNGTASVDDLLENPEVVDAIKAWEAKTGRKFDPKDDDAEEILTAIMEERVDQFGNDVATLEHIKGELEDQKERLVEQANVAKSEFAETGAISASTREAATASVEGAIALIRESKDVMQVDQLGSGGRDDLQDNDFDSDSRVTRSEDALSGLLGELEGEAVDQFQTAAAPPSEQPTPQPEQSPVIKPEMAG
ncbi:hypothetical protein [Roseibium sp. Sym1]|uniref:hypothetical protein n=1 Tax=Roseibium sp. Sym1 TaxID=3016006 RepID=UPI0022B5296B|nr:hypothetical protein [Roseibium sp. Sym1]